MRKFNLVVKLMDGRVGVGMKQKLNGRVYFWVKGQDFDVDNFEVKDVFEYVYFKDIFGQNKGSKESLKCS